MGNKSSLVVRDAAKMNILHAAGGATSALKVVEGASIMERMSEVINRLNVIIN